MEILFTPKISWFGKIIKLHNFFPVDNRLLLFQISKASDEDIPLAVLEEYDIDLNPDQSKAKETTNSLHVAAVNGYTSVVKLALERGFTELLTCSNEDNKYPVQLALEEKHYFTAAVMLRAMND